MSSDHVHRMIEETIFDVEPPISPQKKKRKTDSLPIEIEQEAKNSSKSVLLATVIAIPKGIYEVFTDRLSMLFFQELFNVALQLCKVTGEEEAIPYLSLFATPIYLFHSIHKSYQRLSMVVTALKAHDLASALYFFTDAVSSCGVSVTVVRRFLWGGAKLSGLLTKMPVVSFIFTFMMPIIMVVVGAIGGIVNGWSLFRSLNALLEWHKKSNGANKELNALIETLEFIKGPVEPSQGDKEADKIFNQRMAQYKLDKWYFADQHGSTFERYGKLKSEVTKFLESQNFHAPSSFKDQLNHQEVNEAIENFILTVKTHISINQQDNQIAEEKIINIYALLNDVQALHQTMLSMENGEELALVKQMRTFFTRVEEIATDDEIEKIFLQNEEKHPFIDFIDVYSEDLKQIEKDLARGKRFVLEARSELHRKLIYNAISLLISCMVLTAGILILVNHHYVFASTILTTTSSMINFLKLGGTKMISKKQFADMEALIDRLLHCCGHQT